MEVDAQCYIIRKRSLHVNRKLLILLIIIITGTAKFSLTAPFQKRIIKNYNYWNCTLCWPRTGPYKNAGPGGGVMREILNGHRYFAVVLPVIPIATAVATYKHGE